MNKTEQKTFHAIKMQRDELRNALENFCNRFSNGVHNHMLNDAHTSKGETKCAKGKSRQDVIWSLGLVCNDCDRCDNQCQVSYNEKKVFEAYHKASKVCGKPDAEKMGSFCPRTRVFSPSMAEMPVWMNSCG